MKTRVCDRPQRREKSRYFREMLDYKKEDFLQKFSPLQTFFSNTDYQ